MMQIWIKLLFLKVGYISFYNYLSLLFTQIGPKPCRCNLFTFLKDMRLSESHAEEASKTHSVCLSCFFCYISILYVNIHSFLSIFWIKTAMSL